MELQDVSKQLPEAIKRHYPLEIYDQGKLIAVVFPPDFYQDTRKQAAHRLIALMDDAARKAKPISRQEMKDLLEIDDEEYDNLGLGQ